MKWALVDLELAAMRTLEDDLNCSWCGRSSQGVVQCSEDGTTERFWTPHCGTPWGHGIRNTFVSFAQAIPKFIEEEP